MTTRRRRANSPPDPTPDEIRTRSADIRQRWSDREHYKRADLMPEPWMPPLFAVTDLAHNSGEFDFSSLT
jgi:hypothetical protein